MATLKQVAEYAGVSFKTVSRVINNDPNVKASTRTIVEAAIRELGYRPNMTARQMRTRRTGIIGFVTEDIATTPHAVHIVKGAQDAAWARGVMLLIANTEANPERERAMLNMLLSRQVEGILYGTHSHRLVHPQADIYEVPTVLVDCFVENGALSSVVPDEVGAGYEATRILIEKGHRRIGFINLPARAVAAGGRLEGYRRALADDNIPFDPALVLHREPAEGGFQPANQLLDLAQPPTAIFCGNDRLAMGAYDAVKERGLNIPRDVAIMGFDNQEMIATNLYPKLSTMALPHVEMGVRAVEILLEMIETGTGSPRQYKLPCRYVERASV